MIPYSAAITLLVLLLTLINIKIIKLCACVMALNTSDIMSIVTNKFDSLNEIINKNQSEMMETINSIKTYVCDEIKKLCVEINKIKNCIITLEDRMDYLERNNMANDLVVTGIPCFNNVSVHDIVGRICRTLEINEKTTISSVFRPFRKNQLNSNTAPIIIKFWTREDKLFFYNKYIKIGNLNLSHIGLNSTARVYCNDGLTKRNSTILHRAKTLKNLNKIAKVTTKKGCVFVTLLNKSTSYVIKSVENLNDLVDQPPQYSSSQRSSDHSQLVNQINSQAVLSPLPTQYTRNESIEKQTTSTVADKIDSFVNEVFETETNSGKVKTRLKSKSDPVSEYKLRSSKD